ncbi:unnamed protein product, partial [Mesorhabditis spiculigera]
MRFLAISLLVAIVGVEGAADRICSISEPNKCVDGKLTDVETDAIYFRELNIAQTRHVYACANGQSFCQSFTNGKGAVKAGCYAAAGVKRATGVCGCIVVTDIGKTRDADPANAAEYINENFKEEVSPKLNNVLSYYMKTIPNSNGCSAADFQRPADMPADLAEVLEEKTNSGSPLFFTLAGIGAMVLARVF